MPPSLRDPVDVRCFPDHQAAVIATRLHPADVIAHDEQDVGFLVLRLGRSDCAEKRSRAQAATSSYGLDFVSFDLVFSVVIGFEI